MTKFIELYEVASIGIRRDARTVFLKNGSNVPVVDVKIVDERGVDISELRVHGRLGDHALLESDDVIVSYDAGRTYRRPVPAGTEVFRTSAGAPAYAGCCAVRYPGFRERLQAVKGAKHLV